MPVLRRHFIKAGLGLSTGLSFLRFLVRDGHAAGPAPSISHSFDNNTVHDLAKTLAQHPFEAPSQKLPPTLEHMNFDQFSSIAYNPEKALWHDDKLAFDVEFFPRGYLYRPRIEIFNVVDGQADLVPYNADLFTYRDPALKVTEDVGFSGLRVRYAINTPGVMEECAVFLGASYFRALAKNQDYGLSARGFAKDTGSLKGEEFPLFRSFWLEKPTAGSDSLVIHALMDSPSITGAFRFSIRPGETTLFDVQSSLFPRHDIDSGGVAPLTGMFYFDANNRSHVDDWRHAAHDSEALQMWTGTGQQLYRPLTNPTDLQFSVFSDTGPYGYGLMQRKHDFRDYEDLALHYEKRPSLWIEPVGNWGDGSVNLIEIPTPSEVNDNIVSFWRPKQPLKSGQSYNFTYRMYWGWDTPWPTRLARVVATRIGGVVDHPEVRQIVLDFNGEPFRTLPPETRFHLVTQCSTGNIRNVTIVPNPEVKGMRALFEFVPGDTKLSELQAQLATDQGPISETWLYRWTA
ncbi:glucan biosynthesis protein D [Saccharibacter sp. 17.LH.SD]|uniref:glucan biosynthesis protein n=1 Tax=Saccharibacter sp. 17.LH.SD TaxID=2689393 RepID=UPI00136AC054|nr:glucan biosynthesis protein G [Saccharibacter sp. 17.LH.SD]MXV43695.1 glucan biosynthesis protein D [Saccharibacter sp. 17.LH.SD]